MSFLTETPGTAWCRAIWKGRQPSLTLECMLREVAAEDK
jgi:hypothetical protein